jgi:cobalt-precorrin 5A hydrolase
VGVKAVEVAVGLGCQRGIALETLESALAEALLGLGDVAVVCLASHACKSDEPALLSLALQQGWPLQLYPAATLAAVAVPNPSSRVAREVGTPSVAEAAALLAAGADELLVRKIRHVGADGKGATVAVALVARGPHGPGD